MIPRNSDNIADSYEYCERLAKRHYENFLVGSFLLPKEKKRHIYAIYAFCRITDNLGDDYPGNRTEALDYWEKQTMECFTGKPNHPSMLALQHTVNSHNMPVELFLNLIEANRMDQLKSTYRTFEELEFYCKHSANPVGHMVLWLFGYRDKERQHLSDYVCTALQLTNFWQDIRKDLTLGRIYMPLEDMDRFGYSTSELLDGKFTDASRNLMMFQVARTRELFDLGQPLVRKLDDELRFDVELFIKGGLSVLNAIEKQNYNTFIRRPIISKNQKLLLLLSSFIRLKLLKNFS
jgi:squalene synthase HpnC